MSLQSNKMLPLLAKADRLHGSTLLMAPDPE
jgi:hypothetical protein